MVWIHSTKMARKGFQVDQLVKPFVDADQGDQMILRKKSPKM
jgi:hypothetical protein